MAPDTHHHDHGHGHDHHSHAPADFNRAFAIGVVLNTGFVVVEAAYGFLANSLALLADAGHNLGDVLGLLMAWAAAVLRSAVRPRAAPMASSAVPSWPRCSTPCCCSSPSA